MYFVEYTNKSIDFYKYMGKYLANRTIVKELGMPVWDDDNKNWVLAFEKGECVAFSSYVIERNKAVLKSSWVSPVYRGKRIYAQMLEIRLSIILKIQHIKIVESTATEMSKGSHIRNGFEIVRMKGKYYFMRRLLY